MQGFFYGPTVISNANDTMMLAEEEIFGPVSPVFKFTTEEEAIHILTTQFTG